HRSVPCGDVHPALAITDALRVHVADGPRAIEPPDVVAVVRIEHPAANASAKRRAVLSSPNNPQRRGIGRHVERRPRLVLGAARAVLRIRPIDGGVAGASKGFSAIDGHEGTDVRLVRLVSATDWIPNGFADQENIDDVTAAVGNEGW